MDAFCGRCGGALAAFEEHGHMRARCSRCGAIRYRNSKPAVGAILVRDEAVLLSRRARDPHAGAWDLPGGFLESGEDPEAGVRREILEETGLRARVLRLVHIGIGSYGEDDTLNLVYEVEAEGEPVAMDDASELRFVPLHEIAEIAFPHEREALRVYSSSRST